MTNERNVCAFCKYFEKSYTYFDEMDRCTYRNIPMHEDCTCLRFTKRNSFYTDINDELDHDEQGNTDDNTLGSSID